MAQGTLKIHTENILPIIKKWLYSDKDIFVRELVSNSCDALKKFKLISDQTENLKIEIVIDKENKTIQFTDTGIGMTAEEVEKYIAQIAFSGAEEFLSKYKTQNEQDQIIGHFGLGFYSAYMVAEKVTIDTLSHQSGAIAALWSCDGSSDYSLDQGSRTTHGTTITLYIGKENEEYLEEDRLKQILFQYCQFLPYPIFLGPTQINEKTPLWLKSTPCTDEEYLDFYRTLYPQDPEPIFWIHLNVDYPLRLKGILYFPKLDRHFDWSKSNIKLFCNRVFVSDNCKDLLPDYLTCLRGAIDSPDIPLNVSRSMLQMDHSIRQIASHISKKVTDRLSSLYISERDKFLQAWPNIELIIKLGILQDEKFYERAKDFLVWKTLSDEWTTLEGKSGKIFYTIDPHSPLLELYKDKEVIISSSPIDTSLMNTLERKLSLTFQRIDGGLDSAVLDPTREKTLLDQSGKTEGAHIADLFRSHLSEDKVEVEAKSLSSNTLPGFIVLDEHARRMRDFFAISDQILPSHLASKRTFVINTNSPLIASIFSLKNSHPELVKEMIQHVYDLSRLAQKDLDPTAVSHFVSRSSKMLEGLIAQKLR